MDKLEKVATSPIELVFENEHFVVVNKPCDTNFHDEGEISSGFFNQVKTFLAYENLYPVHRLDKMTSGLVIMAKNLEAAQSFQEAFQAHTIDKYYLALSHDKPSKKQGLVKGDMAKARRGSWKLLRTNSNPAKTQFFSFALGDGLRCFLLKPLSGRTHQIRVALKSLGAPISGDSLYGGKAELDRGYLHAYALKFTLFGRDYCFVSKPRQGDLFQTDAMNECLIDPAILAAPWQLAWPKGK